MRQRDVAASTQKIHEGVSDAKVENDALRDDVAAGRRRLHIKKQSVSQCVKLPTPPAWIMQLLDWQTPLNGIISTPQREADHYAKTTEAGTGILVEQCR